MEGYTDQVQGRVMVNGYGDGVAWRRGPKLGEGSFGSVYLATLKDPRRSIHSTSLPLAMAVKSAEVSHSSTLQNEGEILSYVNGCPNIIHCFGAEMTIGPDNTTVYNLLLEYATGGTLADLIKKTGYVGLPEYEVRCFTRSILKGLCYIHDLGFVHRDLKPENILLFSKSTKCRTEFTAKICDLGLAKRGKKGKKRRLEPYFRGTPMYLSPEAVRDGVQESASDIWSLGCVVLEMLTGKPAWDLEDEGTDDKNVLRKIGKGTAVPKIPKDISQDAKSFIKCCLKRMVKNRLDAKILLFHPFVNGLNDDDGVDQEDDGNDMDDCSSSSSGENSVSSWSEDHSDVD